MNKHVVRWTLLVVLIGSILAACATNSSTTPAGSTTANLTQPAAEPTATPVASNAAGETATAASETTPLTQPAALTTTVATTVTLSMTEALANDTATHASPEDYVWASSAVTAITLQDGASAVDSPNVTVAGNIVTIKAAGNYNLSGSLSEGQIVVDSPGKTVVRLILNGVAIHNSTGAGINIVDAGKAVIMLAEGSENRLSDGANYLFPDAQTDEPNATLFSKADLSIGGSGSLTVEANYNDGLATKDGLVIANGAITVNAVDDGIRGKDYLVIQDGNFTINAQGDGLKSDEADDPAKGYIKIERGRFAIVAGGDAISGETDVTIVDGNFNLTTAGGSSQTIAADLSAKGIKAGVALLLQGGQYAVDAADDAIHSNTHVVIDGGNYTLATADDGVHANASLVVNAGLIDVAKSYEGLESAVITINGGETRIIASDDGVNAADGTGGGPGGPGGPHPQNGDQTAAGAGHAPPQNDAGAGHAPGQNGGGAGHAPGQNGGPQAGQDNVAYAGNLYLYVNGGYLVIDAGGDGVDSNGAVEMTDGVIIVHGPTARMNAALDYDGYYKMTGGTIIAVGSAGMAEAPGSLSTQNSLAVYFAAPQPVGSAIRLQTSAGEEILTFAPTKEYQSLVFSSPKLVTGQSYQLSAGGSVSGDNQDGLYTSDSYSGGAPLADFTISELVTVVGG